MKYEVPEWMPLDQYYKSPNLLITFKSPGTHRTTVNPQVIERNLFQVSQAIKEPRTLHLADYLGLVNYYDRLRKHEPNSPARSSINSHLTYVGQNVDELESKGVLVINGLTDPNWCAVIDRITRPEILNDQVYGILEQMIIAHFQPSLIDRILALLALRELSSPTIPEFDTKIAVRAK